MGEKDSIETEWYETGQVKSKTSWTYGLYDGFCVDWYENGQLKEVQNFINNFREGYYYSFYENGNIEWFTEWKNDRITGENIYYYKSGEMFSYGNLEKGCGILKFYTKFGELYMEETIKNGEHVDFYYYFHPENESDLPD